jgi:hypothetical protein
MQTARYRIRLMFEWGGGSLWCGNDAARARFDVGAVEHRLPLSPRTLGRLEELTRWHDQSLNWDDPPYPGPWTAEEAARFGHAAEEVRAAIQSELGPDCDVVYERL